ncbi:MAG: phosphoenolpyruvate synthase [Thaumarchaeota archaeon]|jgi:pyruvate,water dikinase|nr:phosphoenolpyruvate synthase [Candidatus Terraquivivens yellowstonensis]
MKERAFILELESITKEDVPLVGGKGANLGEMLRLGIPVPPGFTVTAYAYKYFMEKAGITEQIREIVREIDFSNPESIEEKTKEIRELILKQEIPKELEVEIVAAYRRLAEKLGMVDPPVAVRSSATAEDLSLASFAGQQETYLNVRGEAQLLESVKKCWASLFTSRATFYRHEKGFDQMSVYLCVVVQKMVNAKASGVMFTLHPVTGDRSRILIEANWGLGESVVSGEATPDVYVVDKKTLKIIEKKVARKTIEVVYSPRGGTEKREVPLSKQNVPCLTDEEIYRLAELAIRIEEHYGTPQDIEWSIDIDVPFPYNVFIVQSRPETVWSQKAVAESPTSSETVAVAKKVVTKGLPASPGIAIGTARVILDVKEIGRMRKGDILVTRMTSPDWVPAMRIASAIVTSEGGMTCHAAIVSRELGIPCIVGTGDATETMVDGQIYTVDAKSGVVYEGAVEELLAKPPTPTAAPSGAPVSLVSVPVTATKIMMNLGVPEKIDEYADLPFDGIGLMRIEFILASYIGEHPNYLIEIGQPEKFVEKLAEGIAKVARAIQPRPVVVRFSDFKTNEYRELKGGEKYEVEEANPMMGWRGAARYISKGYEKAFRLECKAIKKVRDEWGLKNVWVMIPMARTVWEVNRVLEIMKEEGLERGRDFKVWLMAEVPSTILMADEFSKLCDGFSIGSNDLTQFILATDRDSAILPSIDARYFDERDPAVLRAIEHLIKVAHENNVTVSICGQAPSVYPEFTEFLVRCGIDSISVNPDVVIKTKQLVASIEQKIILEKLNELTKSKNRTLG